MKRLTYFIVAIISLSILFTSCTTFQKPENHREAYLVAITQYNNLAELYLRNEAKITDREIKDQIKGAFIKGDLALSMWKLAITKGENTVYGEVSFNQALDILIELLPMVIEVIE